MEQYNQHSIVRKVKGGNNIVSVFYGRILVWAATRSCFGSGVWASQKPWIEDEEWKNSK